MAEFSKQYVEHNMPGWDWDFDLDVEFGNLEPGEHISLICEGYGFVGIEKQLDGSKFFLYLDRNTDQIVEVPYELANENTYKHVQEGK